MHAFRPTSWLLAVTLMAAGCDERKQPHVQSAPPASAPPSLARETARLGLAGLLPADTAFYFGSANLKAHREALEKTRFWRDLQAFVNDKAPAAAAKKEAKPAPFKDLKLDDFFIAIGKEGASELGWAKELNAVYSEYAYLTMMTGYTATGGGKTKGIDVESILGNAAKHPDLLERMCNALTQAKVPPLMIGLKTDKPETLLKQIIDPAAPPAWLSKAKVSTSTSPQGIQLTSYEGTIGFWLTPEMRQEWMASLAKSITDPKVQARIQAALADLAAKKVVLTVGSTQEIALMAIGTDTAQLRFAPAPDQSLLARKDFEFAQSHASKNFAGLFFAEGQLIQSVYEEQPMTPMLRGTLNGLADNPTLGKLAQSLRPKVEELAAAERKVYAFTATNSAGVLWWDGGLHLDLAGGYAPQGDALAKPRKFTSLLDTPNALFVAEGHSSSVGAGRLYFEKWMELLYGTAGELIKTGLGGEQAGAMFPLLDKLAVPALRQMYDASKTVYQQALGSESAWVADVGGELPQLPGVPAAAKKAPMLRLASVHEVVDRTLISKSWERMDLALKQAMQVSPLPIALPSPISSKDNGLVTWFYPLPLGGNDLLPCVSLNDQVFILGSSKSLNEALAAQLQKPAASDWPPTGNLYRISFKVLRQLLKSVESTPVPGVKTETPPGKAVLPWLAPFEDVQARLWQEGPQVRLSASWQMHDVVKYD